MAIGYRIDREQGVTFVQWSGRVTSDEFLSNVRRLTSDPRWPPRKRLHLADLRETTLDASIDEEVLEQAAGLYGEHPEKLARMMAAIVATNEFDKAVTFERFALRYLPSVIVFNDLETACTWLGIDSVAAQARLRQLRAPSARRAAR